MYEVLLIIEELSGVPDCRPYSESEWSRDLRRIGIKLQRWIPH